MRAEHVNPLYDPGCTDVLRPHCSMRRLALWGDFFLRYDQSADAAEEDRDTLPAQHNVIVWEPDSRAAACRDCGLAFTALRRRHHCRACGQVRGDRGDEQ